MNRILFTISCCLLFSAGLFAQNPDAALFSVSEANTARQNILEGVLTEGVILDIDATQLRALSRSRSNTLTLSLPTGERGSIELQLEATKVLTDDFQVTSPDGVIDYTPGMYYKGTISGQPNSGVALSLFDDEVIAVMSQPNTGNMVLGKIADGRRNARYVLYEERDLIPEPDFDCGTADFEVTGEHRQLMDEILAGQHQGRSSSNCVRVYLECEYDLVQEKGGATGAVNYMTGLWNVVQQLYAAENINTEVSQIFTWTTPDSYPTNSTSNALDAFRAARPNYNGDLAHLVSRGAPAGGGIAWVNALCSSYGYAYSYIYSSYNQLPTYSWSVSVLTHEMGHNLGSPHTHACAWNGNNTAIDGCGPQAGANEGCTAPLPTNGGTIMSYCHLLSNVGIDFNNGFGQQPGDLIRARVAQASCLSACAGGGNCNTTVSVTKNNPSCNGGNNGSATASAAGGQAPYSYAWSNGAAGATATGLSAGVYTVSVTDGTSCVETATVTIDNPAAVSVTINATNASGGNNNGAATAGATGGTPGYSYQWNNGASGPSIANLAPGTYSVTATDANGCTGTAAVVITDPTAGCNDTPVELRINFDGYPGDISWSLADATGATVATGGPYTSGYAGGSTFTQVFCLPGGCYDFSIVDSYGDGLCTAYANNPLGNYTLTNLTSNTVLADNCNFGGGETVNFCVGNTSPLSATAAATPADCFGTATGSATATAVGGTGNYTYSWSNGATGATVNNLSAGAYTVTVSDGNSTTTATATVGQPAAIVVNTGGADPTCNGATDGSVTANATGGTGAKSFLWNTGATTGTVSNLGAGTYTVTVTDAAGCTAAATRTLDEPAVLNVLTSSVNTTNGLNNGTVNATATGGTSPYAYTWSNGATGAIVNNLAPGTYTVTATDANGCTTTGAATVQGSASTLNVSATATDATCNATATGAATATATGGSGNYTYAWSNGVTGTTVNNLSAGTYTVTVDDGSQTATATVSVGQPTAIALSASGTDATCSDATDGGAFASATGGTGTISFQWSNGVTGTTVSNLAPGNYSVTATDANGCTASATVVIAAPAALTLGVSSTGADCAGGATGTATATAGGGTPGYTYSWSNGATGATITNLSALTYGVTVTDANGCTVTGSVSVSQGTGINVTTTTSAVSCNGGNDGSATAAATGGAGAYTYAWSNGATGATASNLAAGTYVVTATDANGCEGTTNVTIGEPTALAATATATNANGGDNGSVSATATGGTAPYQYQWNTGAAGAVLVDLAPGTYTVTITDANGCVATAMATVADVTPPTGCQGTEVSLTIDFDNWPEDINWSLVDAAGTTVSSGGPYAGAGAGATFTEDFCLPNGCYDFVITDSYGDGLCTPYTGNTLGGYELFNNTDGVVIAENCDFATGETVNFCVQTVTAGPSIAMEYGNLAAVGDDWQTVVLSESYTEPVVIATVLTPNTTFQPVVTRVRNAAADTFQLRIQRPKGATGSVYPVYYLVVEAGVYDAATYGVTLEAVRDTAFNTAYKGGWNRREQRSYQNTYTQPVVIGQVMSQNDARWSSFWASNDSQTAAPNASSFFAGKHVGEDPIRGRADELIGYVVVEAGTGTLGDMAYAAALGSDIVRGQANNNTGYTYSVTGLTNILGVVASSAGMDGGDGGWPVLKSAPGNGELKLAIDEDQLKDSERNHTSEQVAYLAFGDAAAAFELPVTVTPNPGQARYRNEDAVTRLSVFPNPASEVLTLQIEGEVAGENATVQITDISGKQLLPAVQLTEGGRLQTLQIDVNGLQAGMYFIQLVTDSSRQSKRFVVAR